MWFERLAAKFPTHVVHSVDWPRKLLPGVLSLINICDSVELTHFLCAWGGGGCLPWSGLQVNGRNHHSPGIMGGT